MSKHTYILHIGGNNTGKAVILHTDHRSGSKAFKADSSKLLEEYGFNGYVTVERANSAGTHTAEWAGPCTIINE